MDKNNKYYAVMEELVKNHRKFQGLDDLLDEIIDDVYAHSEVIINTVDNEAVVKSYLEKVISTSIITVPKKLKRTTRSNKVSSSVADILTSLSNNDIKVNTELVDKMINTKEPVLENDDISDDSLLNSIAESTPTIVNEITEEISEVDFADNLNDIDISEEIIREEQKEEDSEENIEDLDFAFEPKNDSVIEIQTSQAKMLEEGEVTDDTIEESLYQTSENDLLAPLSEENLLSNEEALVAEESENSIIEEINLTEQTVDSLELKESTEDDLTDTIDNEDLVEDLSSSDTFEDELELDESISDGTMEDIRQLESFENDEIETFELNTGDDLLPDNEVLHDDFSSELEDINSEDDLLAEEPVIAEENAEAHIDYSVFDYTPDIENETIDSRAILSEIKNLDERRPNLNIKRIFELKYKNNMKISQIAEELGCEQSEVIEALKEIVDVV